MPNFTIDDYAAAHLGIISKSLINCRIKGIVLPFTDYLFNKQAFLYADPSLSTIEWPVSLFYLKSRCYLPTFVGLDNP